MPKVKFQIRKLLNPRAVTAEVRAWASVDQKIQATLGPWLETLRSLLTATLLPFLTICATVPYQAWLAIHKEWHSCQTESAILAGVERVAQHRDLYPPLNSFPWVIEIYNPLAYSLAGWIGRAFPQDPFRLLLTGRLISFSFALLLPFLVAGFLSRLLPKGRRWISLIAVPVIYFYHSSVMTELIRNRPESISLCLVFSGWAVAQLKPRNWIPISVACLLCAFLFKQWYLAAFVAIVIDLAFQRQWKTLAKFAGLYASVMAVFLIGAGIVTHGNYFAHTMTALASNPTHPIDAAKNFYPILIFNHWRMAFPAAILAAFWLGFHKKDFGLLIYLAIAFFWATFTAGKAGADLHYHSELSMVLIVVILVMIVRTWESKSLWILPILIAFNINAWFMTARYGFHWNTVFWYRIYSDPNGVVDRPFFYDVEPYVARYQNVPGKKLILNDELAVRLNQVEAVDWFLLDLLFQKSLLNREDLCTRIQHHEYSHIVNVIRGQPGIYPEVRACAVAHGYQASFGNGAIEELTLTATPGVPSK